MAVEIRRRFRASAKSEPSFLRERFTGRGNDLDDRERIVFNISYSAVLTVHNTGRYSIGPLEGGGGSGCPLVLGAVHISSLFTIRERLKRLVLPV